MYGGWYDHTLHTIWHVITTRPGVSIDELLVLGDAESVGTALTRLIEMGYITYRAGWRAVVPFVVVRPRWEVVRG